VSCTVRLRVSHPLQLIDGASPGADLCRRYPSSTAAPAGVLVATCLTAGKFVATELDSTVRASLLDLSLTAGDIDMATPDLDCAAKEGRWTSYSAWWCHATSSSLTYVGGGSSPCGPRSRPCGSDPEHGGGRPSGLAAARMQLDRPISSVCGECVW